MNRLTKEPRAISTCISVDVCKWYNRLWEYESTGLTPAEIATMQTELAAYRHAEQDKQLVRVVRCKDCAHGVPMPDKVRGFYRDDVRHCRMFRGDDAPGGVSAVWEDDYCGEGEARQGKEAPTPYGAPFDEPFGEA